MPPVSPLAESPAATTIDLGAIYQETLAELAAAETRVAELRGQMALLDRLMQQVQGGPMQTPSEARVRHGSEAA